MEKIQYLWKDRKRYFGLPLSFTRYRLSEDRIFVEKGFLNIHVEEVLLYRVRDLELQLKLTQRIFGVGTMSVQSTINTKPDLYLLNVKHPREVKELSCRQVEQEKDQRRMRTMEMVGAQDDEEPQDAVQEELEQD